MLKIPVVCEITVSVRWIFVWWLIDTTEKVLLKYEEMHNIFLSLLFFFFPSPGNPFLNKEDKFIGSKYRKVVYREYTDHTFSTPKKRAEEQQHLEIQGIVITIVIIL